VTSDVVLRRATRADLPAIGRLAALLVETHHDFDQRRFIAPTSNTAAGYGSFLGTQLEEPAIVVLVAVQNGGVIGYTYAGIEGHDWMSLRGPAGVLHDIVVDPERRGQGIGGMLLDATVERLASLGAPQLVLYTAERNEAAQRLFERAGFRRTMVEMTRDVVMSQAGDRRPVRPPRAPHT
jgi:ribosomal protein S18 acetylase RimI-like enzyme